MFYFIRTPRLLKRLYPGCTWDIPTTDNIIYLTFDDGPHPVVTPYVLDVLRNYHARATFFCIGKNVTEQPALYHRLLEEGHHVGNHTFNHRNGWKTPDKEYFQNIAEAARYIDSTLFRPPYGRITRFQIKNLTSAALHYRIIMWDVLSADFDTSLSPENCTLNVIKNTRKGSIVVFHDSEKAYPRMKVALPKMLEYFRERNFRFEGIPL